MFGDFGKMMKAAAEMKRRMPELQEKLENSEFTAAAGGGAVEATVNGKGRIRDVKLDKALLCDGEVDFDLLEDLIKAAVSAAQQKAAEATVAAVQELTGGMRLPGMEEML